MNFFVRRSLYSLCFTLGACLGGVLACNNEEPPPVYTVRITAVDRDERPLPGVSVSFGKVPAGQTGPDGVLALQRTGAEGTRLVGHIDCPQGFTSDAPDFTITLSQIRGLGSAKAAPLLQTVSCKPLRHEGVVLIKTQQPGITVVVDGAPSVQTDALGYAYVYFQRPDDGQIDVLLDTSAQPKLQPQNPSRRFQLQKDDEIFEYEQLFVLEKPKPVKRHRPKAPPPKHIPQRL